MSYLSCPYCTTGKQPSSQHLRTHGKTDSDLSIDFPETHQEYKVLKRQKAKLGYHSANLLSYAQPKKPHPTCLICEKPTAQSNGKFCSHSCSATHANAIRRQTAGKPAKVRKQRNNHSGAAPKELSFDYKKTLGLIVPVFFRNCTLCGKIECLKRRWQSPLCDFCRMHDFWEYRKSCNFSFNLKDYPIKFDLTALSKIGMFHPKRNPKGMSRDHMFSIKDGFSMGIPPHIMKHPANCNLILQSENTRKWQRSSITYDELSRRIVAWNLADLGHDPKRQSL